MALQPQLPLAPPTQKKPAAASDALEPEAHPPAPVWLQRLSLAVLVLFCFYLGFILLVLPWWHQMWDRNPLLVDYPRLRHVVTMGPVRGLVSGLGVLDLWIGISELIHYRDYRE